MKKKTEEPAAVSLTVRKVVEHLGCDPEVADFYLFRFIADWGEEKYRALVKFMADAEAAGKPNIIRTVLEHDFELPPGGKKEPITWTGI